MSDVDAIRASLQLPTFPTKFLRWPLEIQSFNDDYWIQRATFKNTLQTLLGLEVCDRIADETRGRDDEIEQMLRKRLGPQYELFMKIIRRMQLPVSYLVEEDWTLQRVLRW